MCPFQKEHAEPGLTDASADGIGQFASHQHAVKRKREALLAVCLFQLRREGSFIHTDAHAGDLQRAAKGLIPEQDVAV